MLPIVNALGNDSGEETPVEENSEVEDVNAIKMYKASSDQSKVILVTNRQFDKLKQSLETKKALLNAKGFFSSDENLEDQLVNNGLLEGFVEDKQKQVQQLLAEAQELYKAGNAVEAQEKMNQVALLNEEIKNSTQQVQNVA